MGFNGWEAFAMVGYPLIGDEMNNVATLNQFFGQGLGRKQVSCGAAGGKNNDPPPYAAQNIIHYANLSSKSRHNRLPGCGDKRHIGLTPTEGQHKPHGKGHTNQ